MELFVLLLTIFVCVFSFANFETTLSILIKGSADVEDPFGFSFSQVFLTFAYIGLVLAFVQGFFMRRLAGRIPEGILASSGAILEMVGFVLIVVSINQASSRHLFLS